jgi:hypothetical protein
LEEPNEGAAHHDTVPEGWYADPWQAGQMRWWDQRAWTGYTTPGWDEQGRLPPVAGVPFSRAAIVAFAFAVLGTPIGWPVLGLIAFVLSDRPGGSVSLVLVGLAPPVAALVIGRRAQERIQVAHGTLRGLALARAARVLGWIGLGLTVSYALLALAAARSGF